jgi:hypothetical protein
VVVFLEIFFYIKRGEQVSGMPKDSPQFTRSAVNLNDYNVPRYLSDTAYGVTCDDRDAEVELSNGSEEITTYSSGCTLATPLADKTIPLPELKNKVLDVQGGSVLFNKEVYINQTPGTEDTYTYMTVGVDIDEPYMRGYKIVYAVSSDGKDFKEPFACHHDCVTYDSKTSKKLIYFIIEKNESGVSYVYRISFSNGKQIKELIATIPAKGDNNNWVLGNICVGDPCIDGNYWLIAKEGLKSSDADTLTLRFQRKNAPHKFTVPSENIETKFVDIK